MRLITEMKERPIVVAPSLSFISQKRVNRLPFSEINHLNNIHGRDRAGSWSLCCRPNPSYLSVELRLLQRNFHLAISHRYYYIIKLYRIILTLHRPTYIMDFAVRCTWGMCVWYIINYSENVSMNIPCKNKVAIETQSGCHAEIKRSQSAERVGGMQAKQFLKS